MAGLRSFLVLGAAIAEAAVLFWFPPERYGFYPACPFHAVTGLLCPGCGATRALAALLHGRVGDALGMNALIVVLLPMIVMYVAMGLWRRRWLRLPVAVPYVLLGVAFGFGIYRNIA